jgi:O-6-methylguanine DNA methyltransferase
MAFKNNPDTPVFRLVVRHPLADVTLFARHNDSRMTIVGVSFGERKTFRGRKADKARVPSHPDLVRYGRVITKFLDGNTRDLSRLPLDLSGCSTFSEKVLLAARTIPYGKTLSYARLAAKAGNPGAVRAAASVMRNNPFPLVIPCHRVIRSDGSIGGFMGKTAGREVRLKNKLLKRETLAS